MGLPFFVAPRERGDVETGVILLASEDVAGIKAGRSSVFVVHLDLQLSL